MRYWPITSFVMTAVSVSAVSAQAPARDVLPAKIDSIVAAAMGPTGSPGLGVAVVRGSDTIVLKGYGLADIENNVPVTDRSVFRIGSITKQFTSAAVMKLVEEGRVRLEAPLSEYLPEYSGPGREVTIHQLLNHTSGIPSYTGLGEAFWSRSRLDLAHDELLALFQEDSLEFEPGSRWAYNNSGYYLLGMVIEKVTGTPYDAHVRATQFEPLGLTQTMYCHERPIIPHRVEGYDLDGGMIINAAPLSMNMPGAAGALCSTARDLVRWARALDDGLVVSPESYATMIAPTALSTGDTQTYGYGLVPSEIGAHAAIAHGGGINGFNSYASHIPSLDLTVVVLANGPTNAAQVHGRIARAVLGLPEPAPTREAAPAEAPIPAGELARYVGTYDLAPAAPVGPGFRVQPWRIGTGVIHIFRGDEGAGHSPEESRASRINRSVVQHHRQIGRR